MSTEKILCEANLFREFKEVIILINLQAHLFVPGIRISVAGTEKLQSGDIYR